MTEIEKKARRERRGRLAWDALLVAGAGIFVYGLGLAWRPLGFIVAGLLLGAAAFLSGYGIARGRR